MSSVHARVEDALTSRHWSWSFPVGQPCPATLLEVLFAGLPHIAADAWRERFEYGGVFVNGRPVQGNVPLSPPSWVEYYEPKLPTEEARRFFAPFDPSSIVYADDDLLIVHKPSRLPTLPAREQRHHNLKCYLERHLGVTVHCPSRLDLSTSGLVAVSRSLRAHGPLQRGFERRFVDKRYLLRVRPAPKWDFRGVDAPIGKTTAHPVLRAVSAHGKDAATEFRVVSRHAVDGSAILEARPRTGRTHQIRVHSSYLGFPIIGDRFYGGDDDPELNLLSFTLTLQHPVTGKTMRFTVRDEHLPAWAAPR